MIGAGGNATLTKLLRHLLSGLLLSDVDDARLAGLGAQPFEQTALLVAPGHRLNQQVEIGAVETGGDDIVCRNRKLALHVGNHRRGGRGGQQQHLRDGELALVVGQLEVVRAKIVAPLGDAVRFIDHQQGDRHLTDEVAEALILQALDRDHQNFQLARLGFGHGGRRLLTALRRIDARRADAMGMQERQLILHQRQQRRDHQRQVRQVQRR